MLKILRGIILYISHLVIINNFMKNNPYYNLLISIDVYLNKYPILNDKYQTK